jgi:uncharacterized membrane-anchored protein
MSKLPQITAFFWIMKICATTLGETAGDLLSMTLNVGYAISSTMLIGVFLVTLVTQLVSKSYNPFLYTQLSKVLLFWIAFVLTRPLGATVGDVLTKTHEKGGLDFGTIGSSIVLLSTLGVCILFTTLKPSRLTAAGSFNDE